MAFANGGQIVTNNLVFALDSADRNSYVSGSTTWVDLSGGNRNGILVNGATFDTGSNSIVLDGTNDFISSSLNPNYTSGSICMWVYPTTGSSNCFCVYTATNPVTSWSLILGRTIFGKLRGYVFDSSPRVADSFGDLNLNVWNHVVLTWKSNDSFKIYLNGRFENSSSMTVSTPLSPGGLYLGHTNGGNLTFKAPPGYLRGNIGACHVYDRDLSANEVLQNYNAYKSRYNAASPTPIPPPINPGPFTGSFEIVTGSLTAYYDTAIYNSYPLTGNIWYDISGNNRNAILYNTVYTSSNSGSLIFSPTGDTYGDLGFNFAGIGFTNQFTYGGWIKPTATSEFTLLSDYSDPTANGTALRLNNGIGSSTFFIYPGNYRITHSFPFVTGSWYNLVGVASGSTMLLYINGNFASSIALPVNIGAPAANTTIKVGTRGDYRGPAVGEVANAYVYGRALSAAEILQNYNSQKSRFGL